MHATSSGLIWAAAVAAGLGLLQSGSSSALSAMQSSRALQCKGTNVRYCGMHKETTGSGQDEAGLALNLKRRSRTERSGAWQMGKTTEGRPFAGWFATSRSVVPSQLRSRWPRRPSSMRAPPSTAPSAPPSRAPATTPSPPSSCSSCSTTAGGGGGCTREEAAGCGGTAGRAAAAGWAGRAGAGGVGCEGCDSSDAAESPCMRRSAAMAAASRRCRKPSALLVGVGRAEVAARAGASACTLPLPELPAVPNLPLPAWAAACCACPAAWLAR